MGIKFKLIKASLQAKYLIIFPMSVFSGVKCCKVLNFSIYKCVLELKEQCEEQRWHGWGTILWCRHQF